jgi:hypothetical protein
VNTSAKDDVHNCGDSPPTVSITATDCTNSCTISATPFSGTHPLNDSNYPQYPGTVTISVNGNTICTNTNISDGTPVQCNYSPTFSGGGTITATVVDSVLYSGSDSKTVNFSAAAAGPQGFTATKSGNKTTFNWSGGTSPYTVFKSDGTPAGGNCIATSSGNCSVNNLASGSFYVQDSTGAKSNSASA